MSSYPDDMQRMAIRFDLNGSDRSLVVDVPADWAGWSDGDRAKWAGRQCLNHLLYTWVAMSWSDAEDPVDDPLEWSWNTGAVSGDYGSAGPTATVWDFPTWEGEPPPAEHVS